MPTLRINILQTWQGQQCRNVIHYAGGDAVQANAQAIADQIRVLYATHMTSRLSTTWSARGITAKELDVVSNPTIEYPFTSGSIAGASTGETLPSQMALLARFISYTARPNRGRMYLPGFTEGDMASGQWHTNTLSAALAFANGLLDLPTTLTLGMALTITRVDKVTGVLVGSNIVENVATEPIPATQRRRRIGVGQ